MSRAPFPIDSVQTAIAIGYRNKNMIADSVLPRVPVSKSEFRYLNYDFADGFTVPDTLVGRKSKPNEVEFSASEETSFCVDHALESSIPQSDIDNAPDDYNPINRATEGLSDLIQLDREVRTANLVFNSSSYNAANQVILSGTSQFDNYDDSDPIGVIMDSLDSMVMRGNVMVLGRSVFSKLCRHPKIVSAVLGNSGESGIATRQAIAALFELDEVLVGEGFINTAKKGKPVALSRAWGKHIALIYRDSMADINGNRATFGFTAQHGTRVAGSIIDPNIGLRGGIKVRVGETVKELVCSDRLGYFIQNAISA